MKRLKAKWHRLSPEQRLYGRSYPIVALTGGIASGKTSVAEFLKKQNIPVISADQLIKDIYAWPETIEFLRTITPEVIQQKTVDFPKLRALVFTNDELKSQVENFLYQRLPLAFSQAEKKFNMIPWLVYEIPLLFERKMEGFFDVVIVTWVRRDVQKERLLKRDPHTTPEVAEAILKAQLPLDDKRASADIVFDNSTPFSDTKIFELWHQLVD